MRPARKGRFQFVFAMVAGVALLLVGLYVAFDSAGEMRTIGLMLMVVGALSLIVNLFMRNRMS